MILLQDVSIKAGSFQLNEVSLEILTGEYSVLMGETGSGKTTLAECICGLRYAETGKIVLAGDDVTNKRPALRNVGYVPQDGALFAKMSVREHLVFPLRIRNWRATEIEQRTSDLARLLKIEHLLDRRPPGLSGGERQRVALGRALSFHPPTLILDEPLSALDDRTRGQMCDLLKSIRRATNVTTLHITHNRQEAHELADRLFFLRGQQIESNGEIKPKANRPAVHASARSASAQTTEANS